MQSHGRVHLGALGSFSCSYIYLRPYENQTGPDPDPRDKLEFQTPTHQAQVGSQVYRVHPDP
jgi:hypothetical protein